MSSYFCRKRARLAYEQDWPARCAEYSRVLTVLVRDGNCPDKLLHDSFRELVQVAKWHYCTPAARRNAESKVHAGFEAFDRGSVQLPSNSRSTLLHLQDHGLAKFTQALLSLLQSQKPQNYFRIAQANHAIVLKLLQARRRQEVWAAARQAQSEALLVRVWNDRTLGTVDKISTGHVRFLVHGERVWTEWSNIKCALVTQDERKRSIPLLQIWHHFIKQRQMLEPTPGFRLSPGVFREVIRILPL
jgi:hypothetical protein